MGILTPFFNLFKPAKTDPLAVAKINEDLDIIDTEMHKPPLTVNEVEPDANRNIFLETVPLAQNLASDDAKLNIGTFIERTTGGDASIDDGDAFLSSIKGNMVKTGYVAESIEMTVTPAAREEGETPITATIDRDTFVAYVATSGTITLTYTTSWSADPSLYGITVTGTPISGDVITVVYVKEDRGTITPANPATFNSTGWNLYNNTAGYAKVIKYSDTYGFKLGGTYNLVEFAETLTGTRTTVTLENGYFTIPSDGYVFITGGDATTYIYATWSDWIDGYEGSFQTYTVDTVDLTSIMVSFPYGLLAVGNVRDEINANTQLAISRVTRLAYTDENLAAVIASGVDYDTDTNYIYAVRENPVSSSIELDGTYTVSDHGIEFFTGTTIPVITEVLYGENLKDYLRHDVPDAIADINAKTITYDIGANFTSQSALESAMVTLASNMADSNVRNFRFTVGSGGTGTLPQQGYIGRIQRLASGRYNVLIQSFGETGLVHTANYRNSAWTWDQMALNSNIVLNAGSGKWKDAPYGYTKPYKYETANVTEYDIPVSPVFVYVTKQNASRGVAICQAWNADRIWINRLHDTWRGWQELALNANFTWENVTITPDQNKIASGTISCKKRKGICVVEFNNVVFAVKSNNQTGLASGFPKALLQTNILFAGSTSGNTALIHASGDSAWIATNGNTLNAHTGDTYNIGHWGTVVYPCE